MAARVCLVGLIAGGHSGVPRYAAALARALDGVAGSYPDLSLTLLTTAAGADAVGARSLAVEVVAGRSRRVNSGPGRLALEHLALRRERADLFHFFDVSGPVLAPRRAFVATVHDAALMHGFGLLRNAYKRRLYPWALSRARSVVAVSQFAKEEAVRLYGEALRLVRAEDQERRRKLRLKLAVAQQMLYHLPDAERMAQAQRERTLEA